MLANLIEVYFQFGYATYKEKRDNNWFQFGNLLRSASESALGREYPRSLFLNSKYF